MVSEKVAEGEQPRGERMAGAEAGRDRRSFSGGATRH